MAVQPMHAPPQPDTDRAVPLAPAAIALCFAHEHAALLPAETLRPDTGLDPQLAQALIDAGRLTAAQIACLERGFALYWQRSSALFQRAPACWLPPRQTNLLLVADPQAAPLYQEPFTHASSSLYVSDLDTHPEYVAYLLAHVERLSLVRTVRAALAYNMSYWFDRDDASLQAFRDAARAAQRPDARVFLLLARALDWIRTLYQNPLRLPQRELNEPCAHIEGAELYVPQRLQAQFTALCDGADAALAQAMQATAPRGAASGTTTHAAPANSAALDNLCDWLQSSRAHVIVKSPDGTFLWSPDSADHAADAAADTVALRAALRASPVDAVASLHADLRVVHERSRCFLDALRTPDVLPTQYGILQDSSGAYIDPQRRAIVYALQQPAFDTRASAAIPGHRAILGAAVIHEWGHLAHAGKLLRVPEDKRPAYLDARLALGEQLLRMISAVPAHARGIAEAEALALEPNPRELPRALARKTLARVGDYLSNMMSARFVPAVEMQAYVRNNVRHYFDENLGIVGSLARYGYEVSYLKLVGLGRDYFFNTTRFPQYFIHPGIVSETDMHALFDAVEHVLSFYGIDESKLTPPLPAAH